MTSEADRFCWHDQAQLFDGAGQQHWPTTAPLAVIPDRPAAPALQAALACAAIGGAFRIGGAPAPPESTTIPVFETLTSGTSGAPRRIVRTQASWIASFHVNARLFSIGPGIRVAVLGRLIHSLSLYGALEALHLGAEAHLLDGLRPDRQRAALADRGIQILYATPAQLRLLIEASGPSLPDLRFVLVGGSKLDPALRDRLHRACPQAEIREFYGAAEASFITLSDDTTPATSVGQPYPGVAIELRHPDGQPVAEGALGEIWVRSPYLAAGYGLPDPKGAIWREGWLSVGEFGQMIAGQLYLAGRASRMVTVADQNVFPEAIEDFILTLHGVTRAAVLPRPDDLRGLVLEAMVMGDAKNEADILTRLRQKFGPLKAPRRLHWCENWPTLPSGKTDLAALQRGLS